MKKFSRVFVITIIVFVLIPLVACAGDNHKHVFGEWLQSEAPTCDVAGIERRDCSDDKCTDYETRIGAGALGHTFGVDATCTMPQLCISCSEIIKTERGHKIEWVETQPANEMHDGEEIQKCMRQDCDYTGMTRTFFWGQPRITLMDYSATGNKFSRDYAIGQKFEFNTGDLNISNTEDPEVFLFDPTKGMSNYLANSQRNNNFFITIMTHDGELLMPGNDYTITINEQDGTEQHSFYFREAATYYLTFRVLSPSGITGIREYSLFVK